MVKSLFPTLLLALSLTGCSRGPATFEGARTFGYGDFPVVRTLSADQAETLLPADALLNPDGMCLLDTLVLTADRNTPELLNLYSLTTGTRKASFLKRGHGPNEIVFLSRIRNLPHLRAVAVHEAGRGKVLLYGYDDLAAATGETAPAAVYRDLPTSALLSPERLLSTEPDTLPGPGRLKIIDGEGRTLERFGEYPSYPNDLSPDTYRNLLSVGLLTALSPDAKRALLADRGSDFLELWDLSSRTRTALLHGPDRILPEMSVVREGGLTVTSYGRTTAYTDAIAGERELWLLYRGIPFDLFSEEDEPQEEPAPRLLCFDWQGRPLACWEFPFLVTAIDIDRQGRWVWCLAEQEGEKSLVRFPLDSD